MGSVMSGSAAAGIATGKDPAAFPFRCELSLAPLITFWTQLSAYHEFGRGPIPGLVREKARATPELAEVIDDLSVIEKHRAFVRFSKDFWQEDKNKVFATGANGIILNRQNEGLTLDDVYVFNPSFLLNVRYGITYANSRSTVRAADST